MKEKSWKFHTVNKRPVFSGAICHEISLSNVDLTRHNFAKKKINVLFFFRQKLYHFGGNTLTRIFMLCIHKNGIYHQHPPKTLLFYNQSSKILKYTSFKSSQNLLNIRHPILTCLIALYLLATAKCFWRFFYPQNLSY